MTLPGDWRRMEQADIATVSAISDIVHGPFTEDAEIYAERLALYPAGCFVLEQRGRIMGYMITHPWVASGPPALNESIGAIPADADCYYLHDLALLSEAQGGGAGSAATECAIHSAREAEQGVILLMAVGGADAFWKRRGFVDISDRIDPAKRASYNPGSLFMGLEIGRSPPIAPKEKALE